MFISNVGNYLLDYTASGTERLQYEADRGELSFCWLRDILSDVGHIDRALLTLRCHRL
jgi:hypothetical protein